MDMDHPSDITAIMHTPGDMSTLPVNSVKCIYKDKQENIWVGTVRGGMIGIKEVFMKTYKDVPRNNTNGLSDISVSSIHEDKKGRLWLGTDGGGINQYNPYTDTFKHYPATYGDKIVSITDYSLYHSIQKVFTYSTKKQDAIAVLSMSSMKLPQSTSSIAAMLRWLTGSQTSGLTISVKTPSPIITGQANTRSSKSTEAG